MDPFCYAMIPPPHCIGLTYLVLFAIETRSTFSSFSFIIWRRFYMAHVILHYKNNTIVTTCNIVRNQMSAARSLSEISRLTKE